MMARTTWICLGLFAAGAAGGWLLHSGKPTQEQPLVKTGKGRLPPGRAAIPGLPEPSGLPGDMIHLEAIKDTRSLRAVWAGGDQDTRAALLYKWLQLDPAEGIRFYRFELVNNSPRNPSSAAIIAYLWSRRNPLDYIKFFDSISGDYPTELTTHFDSAMQRGLDTDPEAMLNLWQSAKPSLRDSMRQYIFPHLFATDPERALAEAELAPRSWQEEMWEDSDQAPDPAALLRTLLQKEGTGRFPYAIQRLIAKLAEKDLPAAQAAAAKLPPGPARTQACAEVVRKLSETDPEAGWAWMEAEAPTNENRREAAKALLAKDPLKAIALDPQGSWWPETYALDRYARDLAKTDWPAMVALAESVGPTLRDQILKGAAMSFSWDEGNPLPKLELAGSLIAGMGGKGNKLNDSFFDGLNPAQAPAIAIWLNAQPEPVRDAFIYPMVERLKEESPATAAAWLAELPPCEVRTKQLLRTTATWAGTDPTAAAAFSLTLPPGPDRDYAILNTALAWHRNAPQAARAWLDHLPDSPGKSRAVQELEPGKAR